MIYYLMGKSASGKDTIYKKLVALFPAYGKVVPYTTRPIRDGEQDGVEYHFIEDGELDRFLQDGKVIELRSYHTVYGLWRYATVDDGQIQRTPGKHYLMIGTLEGYEGMIRYFGESSLTPLYIEVPTALRLQRAEAREMAQKVPKLEEMQRRFAADELDFSEENLKRMKIERRYQNIDFQQCISEIAEDIRGYESTENTGA